MRRQQPALPSGPASRPGAIQALMTPAATPIVVSRLVLEPTAGQGEQHPEQHERACRRRPRPARPAVGVRFQRPPRAAGARVSTAPAMASPPQAWTVPHWFAFVLLEREPEDHSRAG